MKVRTQRFLRGLSFGFLVGSSALLGCGVPEDQGGSPFQIGSLEARLSLKDPPLSIGSPEVVITGVAGDVASAQPSRSSRISSRSSGRSTATRRSLR